MHAEIFTMPKFEFCLVPSYMPSSTLGSIYKPLVARVQYQLGEALTLLSLVWTVLVTADNNIQATLYWLIDLVCDRL